METDVVGSGVRRPHRFIVSAVNYRMLTRIRVRLAECIDCRIRTPSFEEDRHASYSGSEV